MIYFAYGSNLNLAAMRYRCPKAKPLGRFALPESTLVFRGVADCPYSPGDSCEGGIWKITAECERALDRYEGLGSGFYRKELAPLTGIDGEEELMFYVMNSTGIFPPSQGYFETIKQGYRDFKIPLKGLIAARDASWEKKAPTHVERQRHRRKGRPPLAQPKTARRAATTGMPTTGNLLGAKKESV